MGVALAAISTGLSLAGSAASFVQAAKQRKAEQEAAKAAKEAMKKTMATLDVNPFEAIGLAKLPYEQARDASLVAAKDAMMMAREGDQRGVAATAGRVQTALDDQQLKISATQEGEMLERDKMVAEEAAYLEQEKRRLLEGEATGAQLAGRDAAEAKTAAINQGIAGVTGALTTAASMPALYGSGRQAEAAIADFDVATGGKGGSGFEGNEEALEGILDQNQWNKFIAQPNESKALWLQTQLTPEQWKLYTNKINASNMTAMQGAGNVAAGVMGFPRR